MTSVLLFFRIQIDFGRDFERQLDSYVDARSSFSNLETVLVMLVQVILLEKNYRGLRGGRPVNRDDTRGVEAKRV